MGATTMHACKELIIMSVPEKHRFLELMRMENVMPTHINREMHAEISPKELLSRLSFAEFLQLKKEVKAHQTNDKRSIYEAAASVTAAPTEHNCRD